MNEQTALLGSLFVSAEVWFRDSRPCLQGWKHVAGWDGVWVEDVLWI